MPACLFEKKILHVVEDSIHDVLGMDFVKRNVQQEKICRRPRLENAINIFFTANTNDFIWFFRLHGVQEFRFSRTVTQNHFVLVHCIRLR